MSTDNSIMGDTLHRLVKQAIDSGECASVADAEALFRAYRLHLSIPAADAARADHQAALLTAVALGRRVFLGGVTVDAGVDAPLAVPMPLGATLVEAVNALGGAFTPPAADVPTVTFGRTPLAKRDGFHVRTSYAGWRGGVVPAHSDFNATGTDAMPLSCMLSAALAVNEAFLFVRDQSAAAGRRAVGLSLWRPSDADWLAATADEPSLDLLPTNLWLIGLGHLGQAFLWGLGLLPYADPSRLSLVLQDIDVTTPSTESTSVLTDATMIGTMKTRVMAAWAERRGFRTTIQERRFDASFRRQPDEPAIALCGIDNALGRRQLDDAGFAVVIEVGLGRGYRDFRTMRLHTLPGSKKATELWKAEAPIQEDLTGRAAYRGLLTGGALDRCGVTLLAGKAVGAPFVGAVAASLAVSEVLRQLHGGPLHQLIDLDLQCIEHRTVVLNQRDFNNLNPGFVRGAA